MDTFFFLHRSFHAYPIDLKNTLGEHTNVIFGFAQSLLDSISELSPTHIACAWESENQPSFRKELYPKYQITRISMDVEDERIFGEQLPKVVELIEAFNIPRLMEDGFEGDDVIGTASLLGSKDSDVIISTADQDMMQLVNENVFVYRPARPPYIKRQMFDKKEVKEKYGFDPIQMIDYKALRGDPSDNIPGVKGVGDKTAKKLLEQFETLEEVYKRLEEVTLESLRSKLENSKDDAFMSKQLATIITDIPMKFDLDSCVVHDFDASKVRELFKRYEFSSLLNKLDRLELLGEAFRKEKKENVQKSLF